MKNTEIIAIVLRHSEYLPEALRIGRHFCLAGMKVSVFVIGDCPATAGSDTWEDMVDRLAKRAECYSCHPADAQRFGFDTSSFGQMAEKISDADLVISY